LILIALKNALILFIKVFTSAVLLVVICSAWTGNVATILWPAVALSNVENKSIVAHNVAVVIWHALTGACVKHTPWFTINIAHLCARAG